MTTDAIERLREKARKQFTTHGETKTHLYKVWAKMKQRCYDINSDKYKLYGGRGIKVCNEWKNDFISFRNWALSNGYIDEKLPNGFNKWTIDRIDVNGDYEPSNCRWVTQKTQCNNQRTNRIIEYRENKYTMAELSEIAGLKYSTLKMRIDEYGWDIEKAVNTPVKQDKSNCRPVQVEIKEVEDN